MSAWHGASMLYRHSIIWKEEWLSATVATKGSHTAKHLARCVLFTFLRSSPQLSEMRRPNNTTICHKTVRDVPMRSREFWERSMVRISAPERWSGWLPDMDSSCMVEAEVQKHWHRLSTSISILPWRRRVSLSISVLMQVSKQSTPMWRPRRSLWKPTKAYHRRWCWKSCKRSVCRRIEYLPTNVLMLRRQRLWKLNFIMFGSLASHSLTVFVPSSSGRQPLESPWPWHNRDKIQSMENDQWMRQLSILRKFGIRSDRVVPLIQPTRSGYHQYSSIS